jgi:predicted permease
VNGVPCTVVGVAPRDFAGAFVGMTFDVWVPITMWPRLADWKEKLDSRNAQWLEGIARPRAGTTPAELDAELRAVGARVAATTPEARGRRPLALPFHEGTAQRIVLPLFGVLLAGAVLVQLVVCANVANLLLARAATRRRELGVRAALGAGRARLVRELAAEALVLSTAGAALGVLAATGARRLLALALPALELPVHLNAGVDWRVLGAGLSLAALTTLLAGVAPAWRATRSLRGAGVAHALGDGGRGSTRTAGGAARALVVLQLALSLVALVGAGLFARSLATVRQVDVGFREPERVLLAFTDLTLAGRSTDAEGRALVAGWLSRVRALPGVEAAAVADFVPLGLGFTNSNTFVPDGYVPRRDESMQFLFNAVDADYFRTLRHAVVRGRAFDARDREGAPPVAIVNETYVRRFLAGRDPIGATARYGHGGRGDAVTIVGVARDGRYGAEDLAGAPRPFVYVPYAQRPNAALFLHVRARPGTDPMSLVPAVRAALAGVDPALPLVRPTTLARWAETASFLQRLGASVLAALAAVALGLGAVGLYAVTAYAVAGRTREIGVRVALGATARRVVAGVLRDGGRTALGGVAVGALCAAGAARLLRAQLVGVSPLDPLTFALAGAVLLGVSFLATWLPAQRAARVDPTVALRAD